MKANLRWLCLVVTLMLAFSAVGMAEGTTQEPVVIKMVGDDGFGNAYSSLESEVGQMIYEDLGIEIQFVPGNSGDQFDTAMMMLASQNWGDYDIINTATDDATMRYIEAGAFVNLDDYKDKLQNFYSYSADLIPLWRSLDKANGGLYVWQAGPEQTALVGTPLDIAVRCDVLEACGYPHLDTTDDWVAFLKQAKELFPEQNGEPTVAMSFFWGNSIGPMVATYLVRHSGYQHPLKTTAMIDVENETFIPLFNHEYCKAALDFYNTLYIEGLMDPDAWIDDFAEQQAKMDAGTALTVHFTNWTLSQANAAADGRGQPEQHYIICPIRLQIAKDEGRNVRYESYGSLRPDDTRGILATSPNIERIVELIDYLSSEEMSIRLHWGVEGREYTVNEDGKMVITEEFARIYNSEEYMDYMDEKGLDLLGRMFPTRTFALLSNGQPCRFQVDPDFLMQNATETQLRTYQGMGYENMLSPWNDSEDFEYIPFDNTLYMQAVALDSATDIAKTEERIISYLDTQIPLIINAETKEDFEARYQETCEQVLALGLEDVVAAYNANLQALLTQ